MFLRLLSLVIFFAGSFKVLLITGKVCPRRLEKEIWLESFSLTEKDMRDIFFFQIRESKEKERLEKRLLEELFKMFMDSDSFYYSLSYDLTNSVQRQSACEKTNLPLWRKVSACVCLFVFVSTWGMSCPIMVMVMVQTWLVTFYSSWTPCPVTSSGARKQNSAAAWPEVFLWGTDLSVQVWWINWWPLMSFPQILPNLTCNTAKPALLSSEQVDDRFFWNKHMIEDLISIDVSPISNAYYENNSLVLFSWDVCLRPCRGLFTNLLGRRVRIRAVPSAAEQLALLSFPSQSDHC